MYVAYYNSLHLQYWILSDYEMLSKCTYLIDKRTTVPAYRLLASPLQTSTIFAIHKIFLQAHVWFDRHNSQNKHLRC